jgi:hypothetical protein
MQWFFIVLSIICIVVAGGNAAGTLIALATRATRRRRSLHSFTCCPMTAGVSQRCGVLADQAIASEADGEKGRLFEQGA